VTLEDGSTDTLTAENISSIRRRPGHPPIPTHRNSLLTSPHHGPDGDLPPGDHWWQLYALEFGQLYRRLGSEVTILEANSRFLSRKTKTSQRRSDASSKKRHPILTGTKTTGITPGQTIRLDLESAGPARQWLIPAPAPEKTLASVTASHVLVATSRKPIPPG